MCCISRAQKKDDLIVNRYKSNRWQSREGRDIDVSCGMQNKVSMLIGLFGPQVALSLGTKMISKQ
jgi:hypothetical protein